MKQKIKDVILNNPSITARQLADMFPPMVESTAYKYLRSIKNPAPLLMSWKSNTIEKDNPNISELERVTGLTDEQICHMVGKKKRTVQGWRLGYEPVPADAWELLMLKIEMVKS